MDGAASIVEATGQWPVYPGHPLVVAWQIMSVFPTSESALRLEQAHNLNCPAAVADNRISGGGGEAHAACYLLRMAQRGTPPQELMAWADARWTDGQAGGHVKKVAPGLEQAEKLKPFFEEKLRAWLAAEAA